MRVISYLIEIVNRTRRHSEIELGISPRGTAALFRATQSLGDARRPGLRLGRTISRSWYGRCSSTGWS